MHSGSRQSLPEPLEDAFGHGALRAAQLAAIVTAAAQVYAHYRAHRQRRQAARDEQTAPLLPLARAWCSAPRGNSLSGRPRLVPLRSPGAGDVSQRHSAMVFAWSSSTRIELAAWI